MKMTKSMEILDVEDHLYNMARTQEFNAIHYSSAM